MPPVPLATLISPAFLSCVRILRMMTGLVLIDPARKSLVTLRSSLNTSTQVKMCKAIVNLLEICIRSPPREYDTAEFM